MRKNILVLLLVSTCGLIRAQESKLDSLLLNEVVVTGTRFATPIEKTGKTIYRITESELRGRKGATTADLLNNVPGLQIDGVFGTPGSNLSYYLRGGRNKNTLILLDGVSMNDPSGITPFFDLRYLTADQIESIEVLNGGLSTLYGSSAAAGVINIQLKEAEDKPISGRVGISGGSFNSRKGNAQLNGELGGFSYMFSYNNAASEGFSAATDQNETGSFDKDGFRKNNSIIKLGYQISENWNVDFTGGYDEFESEYDGGAFMDADNTLKSKQLRLGMTPTFKHKKGEAKLVAAYYTNNNKYESSFPQHYEGRTWQFDLTESYTFNDNLKLIAGINLQDMQYKDVDQTQFEDNHFTIVDPFASFVYDTPFGLNIHAGARINTHSEYDPKALYNLNPSYLISFDKVQIKLRTAISTSYITPSLYQNFSVYGNTNLNPEGNISYEAGIDFYLQKNFSLSAVVFEREEKELIDFVSLFDDLGNWIGGEFQNVQSKRFVNGYEISAKWRPVEFINVSAFYANNSSNNDATYYRIPTDKWGSTLKVNVLKNLVAGVNYLHTGARTEFDFITFSEVEMNKTDIIDISIDYSLFLDRLNVFARINNLTDQQNIGVYGFNSMGRNFTIGAQFSF